MNAITTVLFTLLPPGGRLVITNDCYRRTRQFGQDFLTKLGVETTVIETADLEALEEALSTKADLFFTELPTRRWKRK